MNILKTTASAILLTGLLSACSQEAANTPAETTADAAPAAVESSETTNLVQEATGQAEAAMESAKEMAADVGEQASEMAAAKEAEIQKIIEAARSVPDSEAPPIEAVRGEAPAAGAIEEAADAVEEKMEEAKASIDDV